MRNHSYNIRALILDVDGVLVGERIGFNSPEPHHLVIDKLKQIIELGIPIVLCTAKPHYSINRILQAANLNNPHITDGGGLIIDPLKNSVIEGNFIPSKVAQQMVDWLLSRNLYTEVYSIDDYFIQTNQVSWITEKHICVLQHPPIIVDSLVNQIESVNKVTKIMVVLENEADKRIFSDLFHPAGFELMLSWGVHPVILPLQFGIITSKGISKEKGAITISEILKIPFQNILGVGDSLSDWQFLKLCDYSAAMGNATQELKDLVLSKGLNNSYVGPSVDEHGIVDILNHFLSERGFRGNQV